MANRSPATFCLPDLRISASDIGFSGLNSACSLLSSFPAIEDYEAGKHPLVCKYMKGVFNINPSLPKYTFTWDVRKVIRNHTNKKQHFHIFRQTKTYVQSIV